MDIIKRTYNTRQQKRCISKSKGNEKRHKCVVCNELFNSQRQLLLHQLKKHTVSIEGIESKMQRTYNTRQQKKCISRSKGNEKRHKCVVCNQLFNSQRALLLHQLEKHTVSIEVIESKMQRTYNTRQQKRLISRSKENEKRHKCVVCNQLFNSQRALLLHQLEKHTVSIEGIECKMCYTLLTQWAQLETHLQTCSKHICDTCGRIFKNKQLLERHTLAHPKHDGFKCSRCKAFFHKWNALRTHKCIHSNDKLHKCLYCHLTFAHRLTLINHEHIHTAKKVYKCSLCSKSFTRHHTLRNHERIHTGEKPYKCSYCDKCFAQQNHLISHQHFHTGVKPYKCSYCSNAFNDRSGLKHHELIHTGEKPYQCSYCTKSFRSYIVFKNHERIHTGEKPYKCSNCPKTFSHKYNLQVHERIHTGEKPYKCSYCEWCFTQRAHLETHKRIHMGKKHV